VVPAHRCRAKTDRTQREQREAQPQKEAPIVNPADKYADKAEALHRYGQYLMSCLPKYIQQCVGPSSHGQD
jgi:NADH dehydrogenase (ubiquinone) Fe-S protein 3